jgi:predicted Ser/Thr protein kinase
MVADAYPPDPDAARPVAEGAGRQPTSRETLPTAELLSRQSTDFGLAADEAATTGPDPLEGRDLGEVLLGRLIAQGGMGRVYEARQRSPARPVAVKLMRPSRRSPAAVRRFRREAELLGRLRHPGIAQVFTAGSCRVDGEETPYFVMEFVAAAETLVRACDRRGLGPRPRLETFLDVCWAVAHGHAAGIVHRDLKPGKILVAGDGRPKVIDFGIARLEEDDASGVTETGAFLGTWQYSSPEQCEGGSVDARADVYALGVILHELLSGRVPYEVKGSSLGEAARVIRETPPARLVIADREVGEGAAAIALKCLAKRPADRYPSAAELADDVAKLLAGLPILARFPGPIERGRQWCRRHKTLTASGLTAIASAGLVAAVLSAGRLPGTTAKPRPAGQAGPTAAFPTISSLRTTPLQWLSVTLDEPLRSLSPADFRLTRDGIEVPLDGVTVTGDRTSWELRGLEGVTAAEGRYELELAGTPTTPIDFAGRRLQAPARATWRMPPYREIAFNLLGDDWKRHVVSMEGVEFATERNAGATSFIRPTATDREGSIVLKFVAPFEIRAATLTATIAVWTTGDPFPYDPRAKAALDVSADGKSWITLETREANRGGFGGGPFDIRTVVAGSHAVWVRARLTASRSWPGDGLIYAQFLRTDPERPADQPFRLTLTGADPGAKPPPDDAPPADN